MGFTLTIQEGKDVGRQIDFDQPEVSVGRTADNDLVLLDAGVSRRHAVLVQKNSGYAIKDLGSANGVLVNGEMVTEWDLQTGDSIALGPVVLRFECEPVQASSPARRGRATSLRENAPSRPVAGPEARRNTASMPAAARRPKPLAPASGSLSKKNAPPAPPARSKGPPGADNAWKLSASERARILRENNALSGKIKIFLAEKPPQARKKIVGGVMILVGVLVLGVIAFALKSVTPNGESYSDVDYSDERFLLVDAGSVAGKVFGFGDNVNTPTRAELHFDFEASETIPAIYYLSFEARNISKNEVDITLNSVPIGTVETTGMGDYAKLQKLRLPKKHIQLGQTNEVVLDNTSNTKAEGRETWSLAKVVLEVVPIPACNPNGECQREAYALYERADKLWQSRQLAAPNAYNALKDLNAAMLYLEAVEPKPEVASSIQRLIRTVERHLDELCSKTMLVVKRNEEIQDYMTAVNELKNGQLWFPGPEHSCRARLDEALLEYE